MKTKILTVRLPVDVHKQLSTYCEQQFVTMSSLVLRTILKEINYTPTKCTPRTYTYSEEPVVQRFWDSSKSQPEEEDIPWYDKVPMGPDFTDEELAEMVRRADNDFTDEEMADLQRRAASAPVKRIDSLGK